MTRSTAEAMRQLHDQVFIRADGLCEWPYCPDPPAQMAHLTHRGMGGSKKANRLDNCAALCERHHDLLDGRTALGTLRWELNELLRRVIRDGL